LRGFLKAFAFSSFLKRFFFFFLKKEEKPLEQRSFLIFLLFKKKKNVASPQRGKLQYHNELNKNLRFLRILAPS